MSVTPSAEPSLGDALMRVIRQMHAVKQAAPALHPNIDMTAYPILFAVKGEPRRIGEVAEAVHLDISTVSRQVATLVDVGALQRGQDPDDGRAQVISLTETGRQMLAEARHRRDSLIAGLVKDWEPEDVRAFTDSLIRFGGNLDAVLAKTAP